MHARELLLVKSQCAGRGLPKPSLNGLTAISATGHLFAKAKCTGCISCSATLLVATASHWLVAMASLACYSRDVVANITSASTSLVVPEAENTRTAAVEIHALHPSYAEDESGVAISSGFHSAEAPACGGSMITVVTVLRTGQAMRSAKSMPANISACATPVATCCWKLSTCSLRKAT